MNPVKPTIEPTDDLTFVVYAKNQKEYVPLPAFVDQQGTVITEWTFDAAEIATMRDGGKLRLTILYLLQGERTLMTPLQLQVVP